MKKLMMKLFLPILLLNVLSGTLLAQKPISQNLKGNLGLGINLHTPMEIRMISIPTIAARYWANDTLGIEGFASIYTNSIIDTSFYSIGGKVLGVLKSYKNFNLLPFGGMVLDFISIDSDSYTRIGILGGIEAEFFILDNLSVSPEIGIQLGFNNSETSFKTCANVIPKIGVKFYI